MSRNDDFLCDLTDEPIAKMAVPVMVRIVIGIPPGGKAVDPEKADLSPFLKRMMRLKQSRIELSALAFDRLFTVDLEGLRPALEEKAESMADQVTRLKAEVARLRLATGEPETSP